MSKHTAGPCGCKDLYAPETDAVVIYCPLHAAAPELLAWAVNMLQFIDTLASQQGINWSYREDARETIAKARGQEVKTS